MNQSACFLSLKLFADLIGVAAGLYFLLTTGGAVWRPATAREAGLYFFIVETGGALVRLFCFS